ICFMGKLGEVKSGDFAKSGSLFQTFLSEAKSMASLLLFTVSKSYGLERFYSLKWRQQKIFPSRINELEILHVPSFREM
ncbi:hypothetical protein N0021_09710, partial [Pseudomonas aeruginosa]|nr:hypothetical protein [Pseudomonas aeruginosa]